MMDDSEALDTNLSNNQPGGVLPLPNSATAGGQPRGRPGPKTPQGKTRVRHNAVRFGIHATDPAIPGIERLEDWKAHRSGVIESLAPVGYLETQLAARIALMLWRLNRIITYEQAEYARANKGHGDFHLPISNELDKIMRYEAHLSRQFYQAKHELEALQKQRRGEATPLARLDISGEIGQ